MFAIITDRDGNEIFRYALTDEDLLDCDVFAERHADDLGVAIAEADGDIPDGCEDFAVTLTEEPGQPRCWDSKNYFFECP